VVKIPPHINSYRLGELFNIDPVEILHKIEKVSKELVVDEFQILSSDLVETLSIEYEKEIEFLEDPNAKKN
jgi:hypothetical protein